MAGNVPPCTTTTTRAEGVKSCRINYTGDPNPGWQEMFHAHKLNIRWNRAKGCSALDPDKGTQLGSFD
jgi:hypothetical protein